MIILNENDQSVVFYRQRLLVCQSLRQFLSFLAFSEIQISPSSSGIFRAIHCRFGRKPFRFTASRLVFLLPLLSLVPPAVGQVAVLTAFEEDIAVINAGPADKKVEISSRVFHSSSLGVDRLEFSVSKARQYQSAITAQAAVLGRDARCILSVGVAGATEESNPTGCVWIVTNIVTHQAGTFTTTGFRPLQQSRERLLPVNRAWLDAFVGHCESAGLTVRHGTLASGDAFIQDSTVRNRIRRLHQSDLVDMNGAGLKAVARANKVPLLVIRMVSDHANENARLDFNTFLKSRSSYERMLECIQLSFIDTSLSP